MSATQKVVLEISCPSLDPDAVLRILLSKQALFEPSQVRARQGRGFSRQLDYNYRNSLSYSPDKDLLPYCKALKDTVINHLDNLTQQLQLPRFRPGKHYASCVAFGDGAFFRKHRDIFQRYTGDRTVSWVYYVCQKPRRFSGGDLVFFDGEREIDRVVPESGKLVIFRSDVQHEVESVACPSKNFADYRFTITGFLYARPTLVGTVLEVLRRVLFPLRNLYPVRVLGRLARRWLRT